METMNTTTTNNKREGGEKDEDEEDKKRAKKEELEEDELETQETHNTWSANEEILEEEVYVQDLGKVSDDVKVVEAEKKSWNRKPLARPIDGQADSIRACCCCVFHSSLKRVRILCLCLLILRFALWEIFKLHNS